MSEESDTALYGDALPSACDESPQAGPHAAASIVSVLNIQPPAQPHAFTPVWYRAWEARLHAKASRAVRQRRWMLSRFGCSDASDLSTADCQAAFKALSEAGKGVFSTTASNRKKSGQQDKRALLYFDYWGRSSYLEGLSSRRDAFNVDVIPEFLLHEHGIGGFSSKLRAERSALPQAVQIASDLLVAGDMDVVMIGGIYRCYPMLAFSAAIEEATLERSWLGKAGHQDAPLIERAGFCVLERNTDMGNRREGSIHIEDLRYLQLPRNRTAATKMLREVWAEFAANGELHIYGGMRPSHLLAQIEQQAVTSIAHAKYENICQRFGDSGGMNQLLALQRFAQTAGGASAGLITTTDGDGATWMMAMRKK